MNIFSNKNIMIIASIIIISVVYMMMNSCDCQENMGANATIYVKTLTGTTDEFAIDLDSTVGDLKQMIEQKTGTNVYSQILMFGKMKLEDSHELSSYSVVDKATINLIIKR